MGNPQRQKNTWLINTETLTRSMQIKPLHEILPSSAPPTPNVIIWQKSEKVTVLRICGESGLSSLTM